MKKTAKRFMDVGKTESDTTVNQKFYDYVVETYFNGQFTQLRVINEQLKRNDEMKKFQEYLKNDPNLEDYKKVNLKLAMLPPEGKKCV